MILVTSLGMGHKEACYVLNGEALTTRFSSVALARLLPNPPSRAVVLATRKALDDAAYPDMQRELAAAVGGPIEVHEITAPNTIEEVWDVFEATIAAVPPEETVLLDVTHGFRSLPLIFFASLGFLRGHRGNEVDGIYYAAFESGQAETPLVDIRPIFDLLEWTYAVRTFVDTGYVKPLREATDRSAGQGPERRNAAAITHAASGLGELGSALELGLSLETGVEASRLLPRLADLTDTAGTKPALGPLRHVLPNLDDFVKGVATANGSEDGAGKRNRKNDTVLDLAELNRELRLIRWHAEHGRLAYALQLSREWVVNRIIFARAGGREKWLSVREVREPIERELAALRARGQARRTDPAQKELTGLWDALSKARNAMAHSGFRPEAVSVHASKVIPLIDKLEQLHGDPDIWRLDRTGFGRVLLTPLGHSPGALYTVLSRVKPDHLAVLASKETRALLPDILHHAGCPDLPVDVAVMTDPFTGFNEVDRVWEELAPAMLAAGEIICNITGGTTAMQDLVGRLLTKAKDQGVPVTRGAAVDRRPRTAQEAHPYEPGEWILLQG